MTAPDERAALAPCPFCGGKAELRQTRSKVWPMLAAQCTSCCALVEGYTEAEAIAAWNRRPSPPPASTEHVKAHLAINALRKPDAALAAVPNTVRQSIAEVIEELLTEYYRRPPPPPAPAERETQKQPFERHTKVARHIERMANFGIGSFMEWNAFLGDLNDAVEADEMAITALRAIPASGMEWMPIADRKPPRHQTVEFLCSNGDVYQGRPCYGLHEPWWCGHSGLNFGVVLADKGLTVTHWREQAPLPAAPLPGGARPLADGAGVVR